VDIEKRASEVSVGRSGFISDYPKCAADAVGGQLQGRSVFGTA